MGKNKKRKGHGKNGHRRPNGAGTPYRDKDSGIWYFRYTCYDANGKKRRPEESLRTRDEAEAMIRMEERVKELQLQGLIVNPSKPQREEALRRRMASVESVQRAVNAAKYDMEKMKEEQQQAEAQRQQQEERENAIGLFGENNAYQRFLALENHTKNQRTLDGYEAQWTRFVAWIKDKHPTITKMYEVDSTIATAFIRSVAEQNSPNTRNKYLIFLRGLWNDLRDDDSLLQRQPNPFAKIGIVETEGDKVSHETFTVDQMRCIVEVLRGDSLANELAFEVRPKVGEDFQPYTVDLRNELLAAWCLGYYCGWRDEDVFCAEWRCFDLDCGTAKIRPRKTKRLGWDVITPLHPTLLSLLQSVPKTTRRQQRYLFPTLARICEKHDMSSITNRYQKVIKAALGEDVMYEASPNGGKRRVRYSYYSLRHTFSSIMQNAGTTHRIFVSAAQIDFLMSHNQKGNIANHYYHANKDALASAISVIPSIDGFPTDNYLLASK